MPTNNIVVYSFRLNVDNPQHRKINAVIKDLNLEIFKSKNQFIADAVEKYINSFEEEDITEDGKKRKAEQRGYITRGELMQIKEEIRYELLTEVRNEIIKLLGGVLGGMQTGSNIKPAVIYKQEKNEKDQLSDDETLEKLALGWS